MVDFRCGSMEMESVGAQPRKRIVHLRRGSRRGAVQRSDSVKVVAPFLVVAAPAGVLLLSPPRRGVLRGRALRRPPATRPPRPHGGPPTVPPPRGAARSPHGGRGTRRPERPPPSRPRLAGPRRHRPGCPGVDAEVMVVAAGREEEGAGVTPDGLV